MKKLLVLALFLIPIPARALNPVIAQTAPVVNQSATFQFTEGAGAGGTWACSATNSTGGVTACSGSINSGTGLYTATTSVTALHVYGGMPVGPNNSIWDTDVSSQPVSSKNVLWKNTVNVGGSPNWNTDLPVNYVNASNTDTMNFHYTTLNNGTFEVPAFPNAKAENGWFNNFQQRDGNDHHVVMVDTTTGIFSEFYAYGPNCLTTAASVSGNVATITCAKNPAFNGFLAGDSIVIGGFTGSDTYFNVASTTTLSATSTQITYALNHANASASTNGSVGKWVGSDTTGLMNSASGVTYASMTYTLPPNLTTDAAGLPLQPLLLGYQEFVRAVANGDYVHHAMRNTFGIGFEASASTWPATSFAVDGATVPFGACMVLASTFNVTSFSIPAQSLLNTMKHFCTFNADGGNNFPLNAEMTRWGKTYFDALAEIASSATISNSMNFRDISGLMVSPTSSLTKANREIVTFTRSTDSATTSVDVALMGPAVNFQRDAINIMAGTPATQLVVLNNYGGYSCTMTPSTGTLTSGCLYTPPASLLTTTTTIVTATSLINSSMTAQTTLTVFASTGIYVLPSQTSNYLDSSGNTWLARSGISSPDNQGCCSCDNSAHFSGTDATLYNCYITGGFTAGGDQHMDFFVPNGSYQVVYHFGTQLATGSQFIKYSLGSSEISANLDPSASAGGQFQNFTSTNTTVSNNLLQVGIYGMNAQGGPVSSLSIVSTTTVATSAFPYCTGNGTLFGSGTVFSR